MHSIDEVDIPLAPSTRGNFMLLFSFDANTAKNHSERLMKQVAPAFSPMFSMFLL
jgi:hypothetical protein